jgi:hypothetical protein
MLCMAGGAWAQEYWVDASVGSNANPGTEQLPSQELIGDPPSKGADATPTRIAGSGETCILSGASSSIDGFQFGDVAYTAVVVEQDGASISNSSFDSHVRTGISLRGVSSASVIDNVFETSFAAIIAWREINSPERVSSRPLIDGNLIGAQERAIIVVGVDAEVRGNVFEAGSDTSVLIERCSPLIEGNLFEAGSGTVAAIGINHDYGMPGDVPSPTIRSNVFRSVTGIYNYYGSPDLGTSDDPGLNDFTQVGRWSIHHSADFDIWAIGNTWPNDPPIMGQDIIIYGEGSVILGPVPTQSTSVSRLKASFD